mgnify:CR=1 FL=1
MAQLSPETLMSRHPHGGILIPGGRATGSQERLKALDMPVVLHADRPQHLVILDRVNLSGQRPQRSNQLLFDGRKTVAP